MEILERDIFSKRLTEYLEEERNIPKGKEFGKAVGEIKKIIKENKDLSPEEIKPKVDEFEL